MRYDERCPRPCPSGQAPFLKGKTTQRSVVTPATGTIALQPTDPGPVSQHRRPGRSGDDAMEQPVLPNLDPIPARGSGAVEGSLLQAAFLSTYVPRRCGIATFTRALTAAPRPPPDGDGRERLVPHVAAMHLDDVELAYPSEVRLVLPAADRAAYLHAARTLSQSASGVSIPHADGLCGG